MFMQKLYTPGIVDTFHGFSVFRCLSSLHLGGRSDLLVATVYNGEWDVCEKTLHNHADNQRHSIVG